MSSFRHMTGRQRGLTLIEILVVLIIMAIGLLGIAGLQVTGVRQTTSAGLQTQAMFLAQDLVERIRANRNAVVSGSNQTVDLTAYTKAKGDAFPTAAVASCASTGCTPAELAQSDLYQWGQILDNTLPVDADTLTDEVYVCLDSDASDATPCDGLGSTAVVRIAWLENSLNFDATGTLSNAQLHTFQMEFEP